MIVFVHILLSVYETLDEEGKAEKRKQKSMFVLAEGRVNKQIQKRAKLMEEKAAEEKRDEVQHPKTMP